MINFDKLNKLKPERGRIMIAEPLMLDPFFKRAVVLLCEHSDGGSFGFILNKFVDVDFNELVEDFPSFEGRISLGGPVQQDNLFYIHTLGADISASFEILPGLFMGGNLDDLKSKILTGQADSRCVRFFVGYCGWGDGQLGAEMDVNSWIITNTDLIDPLNTSSDDLWEETLKKMGRDFSYLTNFPEDPSLN